MRPGASGRPARVRWRRSSAVVKTTSVTRSVKMFPLLLALFACGSDKAHNQAAVAALNEGTAAFPAETRLVVGVNFQKIKKPFLDWLPEKQLLTGILERC